MPDDDTEPSGDFTPLEKSGLRSLKTKDKANRIEFRVNPDEEKDRMLALLHSHDLQNESSRRLVPKSRYPEIIKRAEKILQKEKAAITKERQQNVLPEEETDTIRDDISSLTIEAVKKLASDQEAKHFKEPSKENPDHPWEEFIRELQTDDGQIKLTGEIDPENNRALRLNYTKSYLSREDNSLRFIDGIFASNDQGEFTIIQKVKNYDTGETTSELHEFSLSNQQIDREALDAVGHVEEMLDIYLEEN